MSAEEVKALLPYEVDAYLAVIKDSKRDEFRNFVFLACQLGNTLLASSGMAPTLRMEKFLPEDGVKKKREITDDELELMARAIFGNGE